VSVVLAVVAASLAVVLKMNRYFLLLLAAMFYPYVMQLAFPTTSSDTNLIGHPTPGHLACSISHLCCSPAVPCSPRSRCVPPGFSHRLTWTSPA
jgi:hypothetical protein